MATKASFNGLRQRYTQRISALEREADTLRHKLGLLDELEKDFEQATAQRASYHDLPVYQSPANGLTAKYRGKGLTEAIIDTVQEIGSKGVTAAEVRDNLVRHGLETDSKHLLNSVNTALSRQVQKGRLEAGIVDGRRKYFPPGTLFTAGMKPAETRK